MLPLCITNLKTSMSYQVYGFLDSGADGDVLHTDFAALLGCEIVPVPGMMTAFHSGAAPFARSAVREPLLLEYGSYKLLITPDVAPLAMTPYMLVGRPTRARLGIATGPLETKFPPVQQAGDPEEFLDPTLRYQRVSDTVEISPEEESMRAEMAADIMIRLVQLVADVPVGTHINAPEAVYHMEHLPDTMPAYVGQYPTKHHLKHYVDEQVRIWLDNNKIRFWDPARDGARPQYNFSLTVAVTHLPDGSVHKARVCADATKLNKNLTDEKHQLPRIPVVYSHMAGKKWHSSLDATSCFLQFPVDEKDQRKLAFTWNGRVMVFQCLPFGVSDASQFVQRVLSVLFADYLEFLQIYIDDLVISSYTLQEHHYHLCLVIQRCREINFLLALEKSVLFKTHLKTLGNQVSGTQILADPDKVKMIMAFPVPVTREQLIHQLSVAGYLSQFIRDYAGLTAPLNVLRSPQVPFHMSERAILAHKTLLFAMAHAPAKRFPDFSKQFAVVTDSSIVGMGAVLFQPTHKGEFLTAENLIAICSRSLLKYEQRWSVYKLELGAIIYALRKFDDCLSGRRFVLYTDCKALTYINTQEHGNRIVSGWQGILDEYAFDVFHVAGKLNTLADALSRVYAPTWGIPPAPLARTEPVGAVSTPPRRQSTDATEPMEQARTVAVAHTILAPAVVAGRKKVSWAETLTTIAPDTPYTSTSAASSSAISSGPKRQPLSEEHALSLVEDAHAFGHFGTRSVRTHLDKTGYQWKDMKAMIAKVCADCPMCRSWSQGRHVFEPLRSQKVTLPWEILQIDLITSLELCADGSRYVLVVMCTFTSFALLRALPDKSAHSVAEALWQIFAIFGPSGVLQSDNDPAFLNTIVAALIASHGIEHRLIAAYAPRMAGKVERLIAVITTLLHKMEQATGREWSTLLPGIQLMINAKTRNLTGMSPCAMLLNVNANHFQSFTETENPAIFTDADVKALIKREQHLFNTVFPVITDRIEALQQKQEGIFDAKHLAATAPLPVGTLVMLFDNNRGNKSSPPYIGPYTVVRRCHSGLLTLRDAAGGIYPSDVTVDSL